MTPRDIGIIGEMYHYGFLWVLMYGYMLYLILWKYRKLLPIYIKMYVFGTSVNSLFIFPYRMGMEFMIWSSVLYIASLYITHFQKQLIVTKTMQSNNHSIYNDKNERVEAKSSIAVTNGKR